jgi:hypothetical protein
MTNVELCCVCKSKPSIYAYDAYIDEVGLNVTSHYCGDCYNDQQSLGVLLFAIAIVIVGIGLGFYL